MIRVVRTRTLRALREESAAARTEAAATRSEAEAAHDSAIRAELDVEALREQLAATLDAGEAHITGLHDVIRQVSTEARTLREQLAAATRHQDQDTRHAAAESAAAVLAAHAARITEETDQ